MSMNKPTLSKPWSFDDASNISDPGGVNDSGLPDSAKSIPRRWLNWALNKVDTATRYLMARGIPDWDAAESYRAFDRVQRSGTTYMALTTSTNKDPELNESDWMIWGFTATAFVDKFIELLAVHFPTAFSSAFTAQFPISMNSLTSGPSSGTVTAVYGTVSDVQGFTIGRYSNSYGLRFIMATITDCGNPAGHLHVQLSGDARIAGPKAWVVPVRDIRTDINPRVSVEAIGADVNGVPTDVITVDWQNSGFGNGPHPTVNVFIIGTPAAA